MAVFKKNDYWWIDFYYQGRRYRQKIGTLKRIAEEALNQVKVQIVTGTFVPEAERKAAEEAKPKPITFAEFTDKEIKPWSMSHHSDKSSIRLVSMIDRHLTPHFGQQPLSKITTKQIEDYMTMRRRSRYKRGNKTSLT